MQCKITTLNIKKMRISHMIKDKNINLKECTE